MKIITVVVSLGVAALLIAFVSKGAAPEQKKSFEQDLTEAVFKLGKQHGLSVEESLRRTHASLLDGPAMSKGGVGIIRGDTYVITAGRTNKVIAGEDRFPGADFKTPEVFVFAGQKFVGSLRLPTGGEKDVILALFTPDKVRFFDWKEFSGGYYLRNLDWQ